MPNWTSTDLWCVVLYVIYSTTHQRSVEVQFGRYKKKRNILHEWSMVKNLSCVSCAAWKVSPINSLLTAYCPKIYTVANNLWLLPYEWHFFYMARPLYFSHLAKNILEVIIFGNSILLVEPYNPLQCMKTSMYCIAKFVLCISIYNLFEWVQNIILLI